MEDNLLPVEVDAGKLDLNITKALKNVIIQKKECEKSYKEFSAKLLKSMEQNSIYSYKDDNVTISYVAESETLELDKEMLLEKYPDIYNECLKIKHNNPCVRITVKKDKDK